MSRGPIYGNILSLRTSGASSKTAEGDNLGYSGVKASHKMAEMDADRMEKYRDKINRAGSKYEIDSGLIAGIISRESRAGKALDKGWGDNGKAWGLMQVDITSDGGGHKARGDWDSEEHLCQATEILVKFIKRIRDKFPKWSVEEQLQGGIAAYNQGDGSVHSYGSVDEDTTGGDYSNDVIARAQWYKRNRGYSHVSLCTMS